MAELHQVSYGWITVIFGYALSLLGTLVAFACVARARRVGNRPRRITMLVLAAWSMGGIALWSMHFVALIGFGVTGTALGYEPGDAVRGLGVCVAAAAVGLAVLGTGRRLRAARALCAGVLIGGAAAFAHYADVRAMRLDATVSLNRTLVAGSVAVAVALSAIGLWWAFAVGGRLGRFAGAAITAVAACCAHYIGMAALQVRDPGVGGLPPSGVSVNLFLAPVVLFVTSVAIALAYLVVAAPERERDPAGAPRAEPVAPLASET